jgi:hypothetical protein
MMSDGGGDGVECFTIDGSRARRGAGRIGVVGEASICTVVRTAPSGGHAHFRRLPPARLAGEAMTENDIHELAEWFAPEPLHPDLAARVIERHGHTGIYHELIHEPFHVPALNKHSNRMYEHKLKALAEAIAAGDWSSFIFMHERPYRLDALMKVLYEHGVTDGTVVWPLVSDAWADSENVFQNFDAWRELWSLPVPHRALTMTDDELAALAALPNEIQVYRGVRHRKAVKGLSWTTDRDKAQWFAKRFSGGTPRLVSGVVKKSDVLAHLLGRNESEIVVLPEHVQKLKSIELH